MVVIKLPSRFAHYNEEETLIERYGLESINFKIWKGYNIKPTNTVICLVNYGDGIKLEKFYWAKHTPQDIQKARAETVTEKKMFAKSFAERRCVLLAHGFFEWKKVKDGGRTTSKPHYFKLKNDEHFAVAGLYWLPHKNDDKDRNRMIIITVEANEIAAEVFHRMPAILVGGEIEQYLDMNLESDVAKNLLKTYPADFMEYYEVENLVSKGDRTANTIVPKGQVKGGLDDFF